MLFVKDTEYVYVIEAARAEFEKYVDYWVEERSEGLGEVPIIYPELITDDTFCQRGLYDLQTEIVKYKLFALPGNPFPIELDKEFEYSTDIETQINDAVCDSDVLFRTDIMLYMNNKHICFGLGSKPFSNKEPEFYCLFNSPVEGVW